VGFIITEVDLEILVEKLVAVCSRRQCGRPYEDSRSGTIIENRWYIGVVVNV
jgi:hypothetical protein